MSFEKIHSVYFVGIGGIGMSALARYFHAIGKNVSGYDRVQTELTKRLEEEGISIIYQDNPNLISEDFSSSSLEESLVVYTPAIPSTNSILGFIRANRYSLKKRSEVLSEIIENQKTIAIAGTHGKTTTSAMVAHLLHHAGVPCNAFLGGIALNFGSNFLLDPEAEYAVVEADEYDRSFLRLNPYLAVITSVDADHLDIYGDASSMGNAFAEFAQKVDENGVLFLQSKIDLPTKSLKKSYSISDENAELHSTDLKIEEGKYIFNVVSGSKNLGSIESHYPGHHNVENALAAIGIALELGISWDKIREGVASFKGVKRRFEYHIRRDDRVFIDDYAHHPTEISACVSSVKELYPESRITGCFSAPFIFTYTRLCR